MRKEGHCVLQMRQFMENAADWVGAWVLAFFVYVRFSLYKDSIAEKRLFIAYSDLLWVEVWGANSLLVFWSLGILLFCRVMIGSQQD